ncbi:MAG TPA: glycosyltransferase [Parafilimonas sp.]|nr:glycosyltransferase [Parafilimonas sp.]
MKVVHITEAFESGVVEFLRSLAACTPEIEHTIIYGRHHIYDEVNHSFPKNVKFTAWPGINTKISLLKDIKALESLVNILKREKPFDVIHLHSAKAGILGRIAAGRIGHKKVIYAPHGATFLRKDVSVFARTAFLAIEKAVSILPAKVVGVSRSEANAYRRIGIKANYINNGKFFSEHSSKEFNEDSFIIVTTGRAMVQKNPALFNKIASAFTDNTKIQFIWIGDGGERNLLTSPNIKITGWMKRDEVEKLLLNADLYISTALWEGLSYAVLEAMSMQLPLLLSNCTGNKDLVENGINGFLFNYPAEAIDFINQYFNNRELLRSHGQASFNMLQRNFSVEQMAEGYRAVYNSM